MSSTIQSCNENIFNSIAEGAFSGIGDQVANAAINLAKEIDAAIDGIRKKQLDEQHLTQVVDMIALTDSIWRAPPKASKAGAALLCCQKIEEINKLCKELIPTCESEVKKASEKEVAAIAVFIQDMKKAINSVVDQDLGADLKEFIIPLDYCLRARAEGAIDVDQDLEKTLRKLHAKALLMEKKSICRRVASLINMDHVMKGRIHSDIRKLKDGGRFFHDSILLKAFAASKRDGRDPQEIVRAYTEDVLKAGARFFGLSREDVILLRPCSSELCEEGSYAYVFSCYAGEKCVHFPVYFQNSTWILGREQGETSHFEEILSVFREHRSLLQAPSSQALDNYLINREPLSLYECVEDSYPGSNWYPARSS